MSIITKIKPQKNKKRVNIYLDGKFGFGLDLDNFVKLGLKVEQELSEKQVATIVKKAEFQKTLDKLLRFATLRPRSEREILNWFRRKKIHESLHKKLINKLKNLSILNDKKFSEWWVEQRIQFKSKSKREIIYELRQKGIKRAIIEKTISKMAINDLKAAQELFEKNRDRWEKLGKAGVRKKAWEYLARKGFSWDVVKKVISDKD